MQDQALRSVSKKFWDAIRRPVMVGVLVPCGQLTIKVTVVSRADFRKLEGVISSDAVQKKYRVVVKSEED